MGCIWPIVRAEATGLAAAGRIWSRVHPVAGGVCAALPADTRRPPAGWSPPRPTRQRQSWCRPLTRAKEVGQMQPCHGWWLQGQHHSGGDVYFSWCSSFHSSGGPAYIGTGRAEYPYARPQPRAANCKEGLPFEENIAPGRWCSAFWRLLRCLPPWAAGEARRRCPKRRLLCCRTPLTSPAATPQTVLPAVPESRSFDADAPRFCWNDGGE